MLLRMRRRKRIIHKSGNVLEFCHGVVPCIFCDTLADFSDYNSIILIKMSFNETRDALLVGGDDNDTLYGLVGDDILDAGVGKGELEGEDSNDTYLFFRRGGQKNFSYAEAA